MLLGSIYLASSKSSSSKLQIHNFVRYGFKTKPKSCPSFEIEFEFGLGY